MAQPTREKVEEELKQLGDEYNAAVEKMVEVEVRMVDIKDKSFESLKKLYNKFVVSSPSARSTLASQEEEYRNFENETTELKAEHYGALKDCFKLLQKLRQVQSNYLVGIVNGLQKENDELKKAAPSSDRTNNLA